MQEALAACAGQEGERYERCALVELSAMDGLESSEVLDACKPFRSRSILDRCYELANRSVNPPDGLCARIHDSRLSASCALVAAGRAMEGTLDQAMAACAAAGPLYPACLAELPEGRKRVWAAAGLPAMTEEIAAITRRFPGVEHRESFGTAVGAVARSLGAWPGEQSPCSALPYGMGRMACDEALRVGP